MPVQITQEGYWVQEYTGPYAGVQSNKPDLLLDDNAAADMSNFMLRNDELRSRPALTVAFPPPTGFSSGLPLGITSFLDINGTYHTVTWGGANMYQYNPSLSPPWDPPMIAAPTEMRGNSVRNVSYANAVWYTNKSQAIGKPKPGGAGPGLVTPFLGTWDGLTAAPVITNTFADTSVSNSVAGISLTDSPTVGGTLPGNPTIVGPMAIGGQYIAELSNRIILANISVLDQNGGGTLYNFPNLMWWSANGLPFQWDPTQNVSAGFNPFLDVPDLITGILTIGVAGYLIRSNGITQFAPSGSALNPFVFDHMWASKHGIGTVLPWSIAQYGPNGVIIAEDNIYSLSLTNAQPIGGLSRDAIYADLAAMPFGTSQFPATPYCVIIPKYIAGYIYLTYNIFIPFADHIRQWVYSFDDKNWASWDLALPKVPASAIPQIFCPPDVV